MEIGAQRLCSASHITDAHGTGIGVAPDLAERLHLQGTHKGNQRVGRRIGALGHKAHRRQQHDLRQQNHLPPVDALHPPEPAVDTFGGENARHKRQHRHKITPRRGPFPIAEVGTQQNDIAGLGVGIDLAPAEIGIGILKAARENDECGGQHGIRHLAPMGP